MLWKCWLPSITTVHYKRLLSVGSFRFRVDSSCLPPCRLRHSVSILIPPGPHSVHSFCSDILRLSAKRRLLYGGKQVHAHIIKLGLYGVLSLQNQILNFYVKCRGFRDADRLFDEMRVRNVVTWNTVISGVVDCGRDLKSSIYMSFAYFKRMLLNKVGLDQVTFNGLLRGCIELNDIVIGRQLHCCVEKLGFCSDCFVGSALVDLYGKCGLMEEARWVFDKVLFRDLVLWNVMVSSYAFNLLANEAFEIFSLMKLEGVKGDDFTFCSLLNACGTSGSYQLGKQLHGLIVKLSFDLDLLVASALLDMYGKNADINDARKAFDGMAARNVVSWNTMIVGYGQHGDGEEVVRLFRAMLLQNICPDELTMASILSSCGNLSTTSEIVQAHAYVVKNGFDSFISISNALIIAYSKCGRINCAFQCFISVTEPDLITYTSIINAYASHGLAKESTKIFEKVLSSRVRPDQIAFLGILSACSHGGLVNEGLYYFNLMTDDYHLAPDSKHYTCIVDLLGRAGLLDEAFDVITSMPIETTSDTLGAFLGACSIHGNVRLAKWASEKLLTLEPDKPVNYTLLSNMYASRGHWFDVASTREMMRNNCDYKLPGCSWMEIASDVHVFASNDKSHPHTSDIYAMLGTLIGPMKQEHSAFFSSYTICSGLDERAL
ncbi:hypothetical protein SLE2022_028930 [Rubroshorea leprosula]